MKIFKIIAFSFIASILLSISGVNAAFSVGYNNISIPVVTSYKDEDYYNKTTTTNQYIYTTNMERAVKARLIKKNGTQLAYMNLTTGQNTVFNSDSQAVTQWTIEFDTVGPTIFNTSLWAIWYYNA